MDQKEAMQRELYAAIVSMERDGIMDEHFTMTYELKASSGPTFFAEVVPLFCSDTEASLTDMTKLLWLPVLDYYGLDQYCIKIKGGAASLGAHKLARTVKELRGVCEVISREQCARVFEQVKQEFQVFKERVTPIIQLEREIIALERNGRQA